MEGREVHYSATSYTTVPLTTRNTLTLVSLQWYLAASNFCKMYHQVNKILHEREDIIKCTYLFLFCCSVVTKQGTEPLLEETSHMTFWQGHMTLCLGHMTLGLGHVTSHDPLDSPMPQ